LERHGLTPHIHADYYPPELDNSITTASKTAPSKLANAYTPDGLERAQTYKTLQDVVVDSFDAAKGEIERYQQDTELEIMSHVRRVLHQHADRFHKEKALAKCQAVSALRLDFDQGKDINPEDIISRYTNQVSWNPFEVREVLADVRAAYPDVNFFDTTNSQMETSSDS
jgi:hypothetical protein